MSSKTARGAISEAVSGDMLAKRSIVDKVAELIREFKVTSSLDYGHFREVEVGGVIN